MGLAGNCRKVAVSPSVQRWAVLAGSWDTTHLQKLNVSLSTLAFLLNSTSTVNGSRRRQGQSDTHKGHAHTIGTETYNYEI